MLWFKFGFFDPGEICRGGDSCCKRSNPCFVNEGDCDVDSDCVPGLV